MLYQCLTDTHELKAGKAIATVSKTSSNKLKLSLEWEWINGGKEKGSSEYVEIDTIIK